MGLFLKKNNLLRCWGCLSFLNLIEIFTLHLLLKLPFSPEIALHVNKSSIGRCIEYCHIGASARSYYLDMLDKMQKCVCRAVGSLLNSFL